MFSLDKLPLFTIHVEYSDIMRFLVHHNRHHKVSSSSYVTKSLLFCEELGLGGHFVMLIQCTRNLIMRVYWTTLLFTALLSKNQHIYHAMCLMPQVGNQAFTIICKTGTLIIIHQVTLLVLFVFILIISTIFVVTTATLMLLWP